MAPLGGGGGDDERLFSGVRFVLVGFDPVSESQYRSEIVRRGGADAGRYDAGCTHVVVCGRVYDDPVCVAARKDGKKLVTEQWVDDSLDLGELSDADRVMYRPVRDLNGIPGSESLHICLTGYQRNGREDIMKMVSLMGAKFSKPLIANQVTHLICYKFEGEKYELAKKVNINLVNHRWLEDCLKAWQILPIDNYTQSGWELEIMEVQAKDSEDEAEDARRKPFDNIYNVRSTPLLKDEMENYVNPDVHEPVQGPIIPSGNREVLAGRYLNTPDQIKKACKTGKSTDDIRSIVQGTPCTSGMAISADPDVHAPSRTPNVTGDNREAAAGRHLKAPRQTRKDEAKDVGRTLDTRASAPGTANTSGMPVSADHDVCPSTGTPTIEMDNLENVAGKCLDNPDQMNVSRALLTTPSRVNWSAEVAQSYNMNSKVDQMDNGATRDLNAAAIHLYVEGKLIPCEANLKSGGHATIAQKRKSLLSSVHPKLPNGNLCSEETGTLNSSSMHRESVASEPVITSSLGRYNIESIKVDSDVEDGANVSLIGKQQPGSCKSKLLSSSRTSLKHVRSVEGVTLPKHSANDKDIGLPEKANMHKTMTEKRCSGSPSTTVEDEKGISALSLKSKSKNREDAQLTSGDAVNDFGSLLTHSTPKALMKDKTPDISLCSLKNSELVSSSRNSDTEMTDALDVNRNEAVSSKSELKVASHENSETDHEKLPGTASMVRHDTRPSKKSTASRARNAGTKRRRNAGTEMVDGSVVCKSGVTASKSQPDEMFSHGDVVPGPEELFSNPSTSECKTSSPKKGPTSRARDTVSKRLCNADIKTSDAPVASNLKFSKAIPQENIETDPRKQLNGANADGYQRTSPRKVSNTRVRNAVGKRPRDSDIKVTHAPIVDETKTMASKSTSNEVVSPEHVEASSVNDCETCSIKRVPTTGVRNPVAKRKTEVRQKFASEPGKIGSFVVSVAKAVSSKITEECSRNVDQVTVDQVVQKAKEHGVKEVTGSFCNDTVMVDKSEGLQNSKLRNNKRNRTTDLMDSQDRSLEQEKENRPERGNLSSKSKCGKGSMASKCGTEAIQNDKDTKGNGCETSMILEPACFILSGHRRQRKDYRSILRRLKGRVCRDSHHWSYQATHFIAPDLLRRTEKFFAAAAAGRWILKSDYLSACNEAGKFLEEEPFEWFGAGLNDSDTISLEAPRKWRLLRQQTGHGAFYGMQIIVYGQCISPSLDTLKRAVRSGDGTILATSPPYTRFLNSGVDFAVVSASMPSADAWVQEFGRYNIPCVSADYLVEYVCKPGYPLNKHVLFKTHDLAVKSLEKLLKNQQEVLTNATEPVEECSFDISCSVCGCKDREDVMLICGEEDSTSGCGVGMHIDCCDPPIEAVPDGEWLCPKCDVRKVPKKTIKGAKSRASKRR